MTNIFLSITSRLSLTFVGHHGHFLAEEIHSSCEGGLRWLWFWDEMMIIIVVYAVTEFSIKTAVLASTQMLATKIEPHLDGVYICPWFEYQNQFISCIEEETLSLSVFTIVFVFFFCCCHIFDPSLYCLSPFLPVLCHCFIAMSLGGIMPLQVLRIQLLSL